MSTNLEEPPTPRPQSQAMLVANEHRTSLLLASDHFERGSARALVGSSARHARSCHPPSGARQ
jgi:hypothetical protein